MSTSKTHDLPRRLESVRRRIERWRRSCKARSRIPDSLWAAAVTMAKTYGVNRTAQTLRLDYYSLKERVEQKASAAGDILQGGAAAPFIELVAPRFTGPCQCMLELENGGGVKMRVQPTRCRFFSRRAIPKPRKPRRHGDPSGRRIETTILPRVLDPSDGGRSFASDVGNGGKLILAFSQNPCYGRSARNEHRDRQRNA